MSVDGLKEASERDEVIICDSCHYSTNVYNSDGICVRCLRAKSYWESKSGDRNTAEKPPKCIEAKGLDVIELSSPAASKPQDATATTAARKEE